MADTNEKLIDNTAYPENNVGIAFAMVCIAGVASMLGFLAVIFLKKSNTIWLSIGLAFAAGLMIFVSLVEVLVEGCIGSFKAAGYSEGASTRYAMLLFYAGCVLVFVFDKLTQMATPYANLSVQMATRSFKKIQKSFQRKKDVDKDIECAPGDDEDDANDDSVGSGVTTQRDTNHLPPDNLNLHQEDKNMAEVDTAELEKRKVLRRMSLLVAVSMAVHNFPEGMAVFLGALKGSHFGATIAIAISVHNIPEGFCISMPIYYATGSRLKAFCWTLIPSLAEPLGGLLAYLAFRDAGNVAFAIAFGLVAGIMVYISIMELLPTALSFDTNDRYVTGSCLIGMGVMAFSFILLSM